MSTARPRLGRTLGVATAVAALVAGLAACGSSSSASQTPAAAGGSTDVAVAANTSAPFSSTTITVAQVDSIRAEVPKAILDSGELKIGVGALPAGFPPLAFVGTDQKTLTGSEPDLGRLVAAVLGLKPVLSNATWANLFVGFDSGRTDVGFSNITDTEKRKEKYDFAAYRQDNLGFEVPKSSTWNFDGTFKNLAGKTVYVSAGTNQEKILLQWKAQLAAEGKTLNITYFPDQNSANLALDSGKIDAIFGPNPEIAYHTAQDAATAHPTRNAGTYSGAVPLCRG
jgi:polar amino acid transport system substrate-binding protein